MKYSDISLMTGYTSAVAGSLMRPVGKEWMNIPSVISMSVFLKLIEIGSYKTLGVKIAPSNLGKWVFWKNRLPWFWSTWSGGDSRGSTWCDQVMCRGCWLANGRRCSTWIVNIVLQWVLEFAISCGYLMSWWLTQFGLQVNTWARQNPKISWTYNCH